MEIASFTQDNDARFGPRTLSDISLASNASGMSHSSFGGSRHVRDTRVKFMCSHGGKIMPRPSDRKLRYVGGETRMVSVPRHIHYNAFLHKMREIYGSDFLLKYQLPEEDMDALVSVSCDEDLENMMEECDRLDAMEGTTRLRVFIFTSSDLDTIDLSDIADPRVSEQRYVDAVNAVQVEVSLRKSEDAISLDASRKTVGYSGNSHVLHVENLQILGSGNAQAQKLGTMTNNVTGPITPPIHAVVTRPRKVPSDLSLNQHHGNPHGLPVGVDDFLDLESGGSASSSTSSQHDLHHRYSNHRWATPATQIQSQLDTKHYEGGELHMYDQMQVVDPNLNRSGIDSGIHTPAINFLPSIGISNVGEQIYVQETYSENRKPDTVVDPEVPLSPGAKLQMQLQADNQLDIGVRRNLGLENLQYTTNTEFFMQSSTANQVLIEQQHSPFYKDDMLGVGGHALDTTFGNQVSPPHHPQSLAPSIFSPPSATISFGIGHSESAEQPSLLPKQDNMQDGPSHLAPIPDLEHPKQLYNPDGRDSSNLPWLTLQTPYQETSTSALHTESFEISSPKKKNEMNHPTLAFTDERPLHDFDYGQKSQAPWLLPSAMASFVVPQDGHNADEKVLDIHSRLSGISGNTGTQLHGPGLSLLDELVKLDDVTPQITENFSGNISETDNNMSTSFREKQTQGVLNVELSLGSIARSETPIAKTSGDLASDLLQGLNIQASKHEETTTTYNTNTIRKQDIDLNGIVYQKDDNKPKTTEEPSQATGFTIQSQASLVEVWSTVKEPDQDHGNGPEEEQILEKNQTMEVEELSSEIEVETFKSMDERPMNLAAMAEQEAIKRGLQTIRNIDLEELRELGSGTFGTVYHGKWRGTDVAIKRIKSSCFTGRPAERDRLIADFWQEACLLGQLHHPNVVAFYGVVPDGPNGTLATVTEYMVNGSLKQALVKKDRVLDRRKRLLIAMDAAFGMEYLHGKNVVHFDMKCENLLVNLRDIQRPICKVGDLGLSKVKQQTMISGGVRGTLPWMAPELLNGSSSLVSEKVDVFSFGIVLWELLTGEEPYANMHYGAIIGGIVSNTLRPPIPKSCDPAWRSLMEACWSADPSKRPTFSEIARRLREMEAALHVKGQGQSHGQGLQGQTHSTNTG